MPTTMALLKRALDAHKAAHWARMFNLTDSALTQAKKRGRLSPLLAGKFAHELGEDEAQWIAIAGLEAEPPSRDRDEMLARLANVSVES